MLRWKSAKERSLKLTHSVIHSFFREKDSRRICSMQIQMLRASAVSALESA